MLLASIDVGSNSIRLLVGEVISGKVKPVRYGRAVTRLAAGIGKGGPLRPEAMEDTIRALKDFSGILKKEGAVGVRAVGTSAVREAANGREFVDEALSQTGIKIEPISGDEEAELTAKGVLSSILASGASLILDIGGGSTEWSTGEGTKLVHSASIPTGVVKLFEEHIKTDPPSKNDMDALDSDIESSVDGICSELVKIGPIKRHRDGLSLISTAGTATTIASLDMGLEAYERSKVHMHEVSLERLNELSRLLISLPVQKRALLRGLEPGRADLIIPGIRFTIILMKALGFGKMTVSAYGLLEGLLAEFSSEVSNSLS